MVEAVLAKVDRETDGQRNSICPTAQSQYEPLFVAMKNKPLEDTATKQSILETKALCVFEASRGRKMGFPARE